jgi:hypothetical protein
MTRNRSPLVPRGGTSILNISRRPSSGYQSFPSDTKAARSYPALRRAAHYPLSLPPYSKAFMASLGVHRRLPCQVVNLLRQVVFAKTLAQGAVPGKTAFCCFLSDEKLLGRFWVLIHIATTLRRLSLLLCRFLICVVSQWADVSQDGRAL